MANQIRITYGDFEKYLKIYEFAMKNGNFIIFFWQISAKACSIMVSKVKCMGMSGRAYFSRICFFPQGICTFFVSCFYAGGKMLLFFDVLFFGFARVSFKKQQKKLFVHSKVKKLNKKDSSFVNFKS